MKIIGKFFKIVLNIFFFIWVLINLILIIKSIVFPNEVPGILGYKPFLVSSGSIQTDVRKGDFVITKEVKQIEKGDVVVVKTDKKKATTYSVKEVKGDNLKLETNTDELVSLSKSSIEGKMVLDIRGLGDICFLLRQPIIAVVFIVLGIILSICVYKIKLLF